MATDRRDLTLVILLALVSVAAFQGSRGLYESTEGRYAEVAREMIETRNFLEPTLDYKPHWTKPPMTYWAIAAGVRTFGRNAWGARFYNVIAFVVTVVAVAACGCALWDRKTGACAGLVYSSSLLPALGASVVSADGLLAMWETLAVLFYAKAYRCPKEYRSAWWVRAMWLAFGLAFFTKGPPALLPLIALCIFHFLSRRPHVFFDFAGILVFVVTAFWWFVAVVARHPDLFAYFVGKEVVARNVSSGLGRNGEWYGPLTIYAPVLVVGQGAWIYYGLRMLKVRGLYKPAQIGRLFRSGTSPQLLLFLWFLVPLVIFCLSRSRLQLYILPLFAPVALATARFIVLSYGDVTGFRRAARIAAISVLVIVAVKGVAARVPARKDMAQLYRNARQAAGGVASYELFRERELYGFQFYANGHVGRVTTSGKEPYADRSLAALLEEIATKPAAEKYVVISSRRNESAVARALNDANVSSTEVEANGWKLFLVSGGEGSEGKSVAPDPVWSAPK